MSAMDDCPYCSSRGIMPDPAESRQMTPPLTPSPPSLVTWPQDTEKHGTNYKRDWEGQEFFYVMDKRQSGIKKIVGNRIFMSIEAAAVLALEMHAAMGSVECYYEVRCMVCPWLDSSGIG